MKRALTLLTPVLLLLGLIPPTLAAQVTATRLAQNPLITVNSSPTLAGNVNGPSMIRVPDWVDHPLGRYYLYFANHKGKFIRLAYANSVTGPWKIYEPGVLQVKDTAFYCPQPDPPNGSLYTHVASPEIFIDREKKKIILWAHGMWTDGKAWPGAAGGDQPSERQWLIDNRYEQYTQSFESIDGLHFTAHPAITKHSYLRVFKDHDMFYGVARGGKLFRSKDPFAEFEPGTDLFRDSPHAGRVRHTALLRRGDTLYVFFSAIGDAPEHIQVAEVDLTKDWTEWKAGPPADVLTSQVSYECFDLPLAPSKAGDIDTPVHQLRDPGIFEDDGKVYLFYSICGEQGLAAAEVSLNYSPVAK
jgi:hypothetical protein